MGIVTCQQPPALAQSPNETGQTVPPQTVKSVLFSITCKNHKEKMIYEESKRAKESKTIPERIKEQMNIDNTVVCNCFLYYVDCKYVLQVLIVQHEANQRRVVCLQNYYQSYRQYRSILLAYI